MTIRVVHIMFCGLVNVVRIFANIKLFFIIILFLGYYSGFCYCSNRTFTQVIYITIYTISATPVYHSMDTLCNTILLFG